MSDFAPKFSPLGLNIVCFDLETKRPVEGEVTWTRHDLMGISVGCLFDYKTGEFSVHMDDNLEELAERLCAADLVTGFNIEGFDIPLLKATLVQGGYMAAAEALKIKSYDLLYWSRYASGWRMGMKYPKGLKLDEHLLGTFGQGFMKTGDGAEAPKWYQEKKIGKLISYCLGDVHREKTLFEHVWNGRQVVTPTHGAKTLRNPYEVLFELNPGRFPDLTPATGGALDPAAQA